MFENGGYYFYYYYGGDGAREDKTLTVEFDFVAAEGTVSDRCGAAAARAGLRRW